VRPRLCHVDQSNKINHSTGSHRKTHLMDHQIVSSSSWIWTKQRKNLRNMNECLKWERKICVLCVVCDLLRWVHLLFWENYPINLEKHWEQGKNHNANVCIAGGKDSSQKNVDGTLWWSNCRPYSGTRCRESRRFEIVFKKAIMFGFGYWNLVK